MNGYFYSRAAVRVRIKRNGSDVQANDCNPVYNDGVACVAFQGTNNSADPETCYFYGKTFQQAGHLEFGYYSWADGAWGTRWASGSNSDNC